MFGLLNLNKPAGWTSRDAVTRISRLLGRKVKVGHAGTLDPLATGVLVICVGSTTRLVPLIHEHPKTYEGEFLLGARSDTVDIEGDMTPVEIPKDLTADRLLAVLPEFTGTIQQVPPAYSAVKINGKRAYQAARRGEQFDLSARDVQIHRLELAAFHPETSRFSLSINCGTGTYIRSLGRDIARRLETDAVMSKLVRTAVGPFSVTESFDPESFTRENLSSRLISPLAMLPHLPRLELTEEEIRRLEFGQTLNLPDQLSTSNSISTKTEAGTLRVIVDARDRLRSIAVEQAGRLAPHLVFKLSE